MRKKLLNLVINNKKIFLIGLVLLVIVCVVGLLRHRDNSNVAPDKDGVIRYSTNKPSQKKPDKNYSWQGEAKDPKKILIPQIGVDAYIQKVGVDQNQEVAVPNNLFLVGWFVDTVRPGEKGLSLLDGHVTGRENDGVFKNLDKLQAGDKFSVQLGDDSIRTFRVIGKQSVPTKDSVNIMFSQLPKVASQLNLVTCSGEYNPITRTYAERLTVMAEGI